MKRDRRTPLTEVSSGDGVTEVVNEEGSASSERVLCESKEEH